jgi:hypothetical protein
VTPSLLAGALLVVLGLTASSALAWSAATSASHTVSTATLGAPQGVDCVSPTGVPGPISFSWTAPAALSGKPTGPLSYDVERRGGGGAWDVVATGLVAPAFSEDPSGLLGLGSVWEYRVTARYGSWTSPVSATVTGVYGSVLLVTVLTTCTP